MQIKFNYEMCATPNVVDKAKRYTKSDVRARDLPGMRWFILSLYVAFVSAARPVLTLSGWPLPMQFSNHIGIALTFLLMGIGTYRYLITQKVHLLYRKSYLMKTKIWFALLVMLACYGIFRRNEFLYVIREMIVFSYIGVFLLFGGDDRFWQVMVKHLTILFYAGCLLIFVFFQVPMASIEELGKDIGALTLVGERYTWSVSYYLRPLIATGLLIGMWGLIGREGRTWKIFQIPAWFLFFACEVGLFKFRAAAGFVILAVLSYILLKPYLEQRLRLGIPLIFLSLCFVAFTYYISTQSWELVINRVAESRQGEGIFGSRLAEFHAYMSDMGLMVLAGRGLGGTFDASTVFYNAYNWSTLHFGILLFTLKGGVLFLILFMSFLWPALKLRRRSWYRNPCNLAAALLLPVYLVRFFTVPFSTAPESIFIHLPAMMVLARFGRTINAN